MRARIRLSMAAQKSRNQNENAKSPSQEGLFILQLNMPKGCLECLGRPFGSLLVRIKLAVAVVVKGGSV